MRLDRDRLTWLAYLQVAAYGYFLYGFGPTVSLLRDEQGISRTLSGLHGTALAVGALLAEPEMFQGRSVCCVVSGGNVDPEVYRSVLAG